MNVIQAPNKTHASLCKPLSTTHSSRLRRTRVHFNTNITSSTSNRQSSCNSSSPNAAFPQSTSNIPADDLSTTTRRALFLMSTTTATILSACIPFSSSFITAHAADQPDFVEQQSGLLIQDIKIGTGTSPQKGDIIECNWVGYTKGYQAKRIENTAVRDDPYIFKLGAGEAIPAFEEAVAGMKVGGIRRIECPGSHPELVWPRTPRGERYNKGPKPSELGGQRALDFVLDNPTLQDFNRTILLDIQLLGVRKTREEQDLQRGAILKAPIHPPPYTTTTDPSPSAHDLVFIHYTITSNKYILSSTRSQDGGSGLPVPILLGPLPSPSSSTITTTTNRTTTRYPRGIELALFNMKLGERTALKINPKYGFLHPHCTVPPPRGLDTSAPLEIDIQLTHIYPHTHTNREADSTTTINTGFICLSHSDGGVGIFKKVTKQGNGWETPREPFQVKFHIEAFTLSSSLEEDQLPMVYIQENNSSNNSEYEKRRYFSSRDDGGGRGGGEQSSKEAIQCQLGMGALPPGIEKALASMNIKEQCIILCPVDLATTTTTTTNISTTNAAAVLLPPPPVFIDDTAVAAPAYGMFILTLEDFSQVRDLVGDGSAVKSIIRKGKGEFPMDCPLEDSQVTIHYRLKKKNGGDKGWLFDTRDITTKMVIQDDDSVASDPPPPVVIETGTGQVPDAMDLAIRMMLRGEICQVEATWEKCYKNIQAATNNDNNKIMPSGELLAELQEYKDKLIFEIELIDFEAEPNWHHLPTDGKLDRAEKWKDAGNTLYKSSKYILAKQKYLKAAKLIGEVSRDVETEEQAQRCEQLNVALLNNLALCAFKLEEFGDALKYCDKVLTVDPLHGKAYFRRATAHAALGEFEAAAEDLAAAERSDPTTKDDVSRERVRLAAREKAAAVKQKKEFGNFF